MSKIIHARLDDETARMRRQLARRLGWSDSRIVREGIRVLAAIFGRKGRRRIIGQGKFESGIPDLGSNKEHLKGFGQ
jgi:hypothetical protein